MTLLKLLLCTDSNVELKPTLDISTLSSRWRPLLACCWQYCHFPIVCPLSKESSPQRKCYYYIWYSYRLHLWCACYTASTALAWFIVLVLCMCGFVWYPVVWACAMLSHIQLFDDSHVNTRVTAPCSACALAQAHPAMSCIHLAMSCFIYIANFSRHHPALGGGMWWTCSQSAQCVSSTHSLQAGTVRSIKVMWWICNHIRHRHTGTLSSKDSKVLP